MAAYVIAELEITDPAVYAEYQRRVNAVNDKYGGKFIVRGENIRLLDGPPPPKRVAIVEFPSMEQALKWYQSPEYTELVEIRQRSSRARFMLVEGL